jgi:hypothetical protein
MYASQPTYAARHGAASLARLGIFCALYSVVLNIAKHSFCNKDVTTAADTLLTTAASPKFCLVPVALLVGQSTSDPPNVTLGCDLPITLYGMYWPFDLRHSPEFGHFQADCLRL